MKSTIIGVAVCAMTLCITPIMGGCHQDTDITPDTGKNDNGGKPAASKVNPQMFELLNLDATGLEKVKSLHSQGKDTEAAKALLTYYRNRTNVVHPDVNLLNVTISADEKKMAEESLEHKFFAHKGYQPSYFYGNDINWEYWPVKDNELRWQLHRQKWFIPLGKSYRISSDEKYAKAWVDQYMDWIKKNPMPEIKLSYEDPGREDQYQNMRFAWRPLEVSARLEDQPAEFLYFMNSTNFTPEFLSEFLVNYAKHAKHITENFSDKGNHLLFEAQRLIYAGSFFPEYKQAQTWRRTGVDILNREINIQVMDDGMQFELDFGYHMAAIDIFFKALNMAKANGFDNEFPASYLQTIEKMTQVTINTLFPNYSQPMFSDNKLQSKSVFIRNFKSWSKVYPDNTDLQYMASEGKSGQVPNYLSKAFKTSGFYVLRNGWIPSSTVMIVKAGPPAFWHNQPDNGTFELYVNGRNFFPDSGAYIYAGEGEVMQWRNWFRKTRVHNTLTLNSEDITTTDSKLKLFSTEGATDILVTENQGYTNLKHRRSVFFVNRSFYVIVDEAVGSATGAVNLNWALKEGAEARLNLASNGAYTAYTDNNNLSIQTFSPLSLTSTEQEGWVSYSYNNKQQRKAYSVNATKAAAPARFITVIVPTTTAGQVAASATFKDADYNPASLQIEVTVSGTKYVLGYKL